MKLINYLLVISLLFVFEAQAQKKERKKTDQPNPVIEDLMKSSKFIPGVYNVEDFMVLPGTKWIVGSGLLAYNAGFVDPIMKQNYLHLFDGDAETGRQIEPEEYILLPDLETYPGSTPPNFSIFSTHGLSVGERVGDIVTFYVVNHGGREAIEIFKIDVSREEPRFVWVGNVVSPEDGWPDAVCAIPNSDGFLATAMSDPTDPKAAFEAQMKGAPVGWVREWHPETGWSDPLPGTESFSSPNGIITSADGKTVYVGTSSGMKIHKFQRGGGDPQLKSISLSGPADNLRWAPDGKTFTCAVHTTAPVEFSDMQVKAAASGGNLLTTFEFLRVNPETLETEVYVPSAVYGALGASCTLIEYKDRIWLSSCKSDRVGVFNKP